MGESHTVLSPFGVRRGSGGREGEVEKVRGRSLRFVRKLKAKGGSISLLLLLDRRLPSEAEERTPVVLQQSSPERLLSSLELVMPTDP